MTAGAFLFYRGELASIKTVTVNDVLYALDDITGGRCVTDRAVLVRGKHPFVMTKSSDIPGKACTEMPGLVFGNPAAPVKKIAVTMTLTESCIELSGALGIDVIVAHHPIADAANSGGVTLRNYLSLYGIAVFELHEAFHGLHPGIAFIHGHRVFRTDISYGNVPGNIVMVGKALSSIYTLGNILDRITLYTGILEEEQLLLAEQSLRKCPQITEATVATTARILVGERDTPVQTVIHIFPHTGFTAQQLRTIKQEHPEADTVIASISHLLPGHELIDTAKELGMNLLLGNSHTLEIMENGMPLAAAIQILLPQTQVIILRERVTATPLKQAGNALIREYAAKMAEEFLIPRQGAKISNIHGKGGN